MTYTAPLSPVLLEAINSVLFVLFLSILAVFGKYIIDGFKSYGWVEGRRNRLGGISMFVFILGDAIIRFFVWLWRHHENNGTLTDNIVFTSTIGTTVGVVVCIFGGFCILRIFTPFNWGHWPAIGTLIAAILFTVATLT